MISSAKRLILKNWPVLIILLLAGLIRLLYLTQYYQLDFWNQLTVDNYYHLNWATAYANGDWLGGATYFRAPFYIIILGILFKFTSTSILAARIMGSMIGLLSILTTYLIGKRAANKSVGLIAAAIHALYPIMIYFEGEILLDPLFTLLFEIAILRLLIWYEKQTSNNIFILGLMIGIAAITRPSALILLPICAIIILLKSELRLHFVKQFSLVLIGTIVIVAPITMRNLIVANDPVLISSQGGINFYIGNNKAADGISAGMPEPLGLNWTNREITRIAETDEGRELSPGEVSSFWYSRAYDEILDDPILFLKRIMLKLSYTVSNREFFNNRPLTSFMSSIPILNYNPLSFGILFLFALFGGIFTYRRYKAVPILLSVVVTYLLSISLFFVSSRFRIPVLPLMMVLASIGLYFLPRIFLAGNRKPILTILLVISLSVLTFIPVSLSSRSSSTPPSLTSGNFFFSQGSYKLALDYYKRALNENPLFPQVNLNIGAAFIKLGQTDSASYYLERETNLFPLRSEGFVNLASLAVIRGEYNSARRLADSATKLEPYDLNAYKVLIQTLTRSKNADNAALLEAINKMKEQTLGYEKVNLDAAIALIESGESDSAELILKRTVECESPPVETDDHTFLKNYWDYRKTILSTKAKSYYLLAFLYAERGSYSKSLDYSRSAITIDSTLLPAYLLTINNYRALQRYGLSDSLLEYIQGRFPDDSLLRLYHQTTRPHRY